jgi:hypothetical protein
MRDGDGLSPLGVSDARRSRCVFTPVRSAVSDFFPFLFPPHALSAVSCGQPLQRDVPSFVLNSSRRGFPQLRRPPCLGNGTGTPAGIGTPTRTRTRVGRLPVIPRVGAQRVCCAGRVGRVDGSIRQCQSNHSATKIVRFVSTKATSDPPVSQAQSCPVSHPMKSPRLHPHPLPTPSNSMNPDRGVIVSTRPKADYTCAKGLVGHG